MREVALDRAHRDHRWSRRPPGWCCPPLHQTATRASVAVSSSVSARPGRRSGPARRPPAGRRPACEPPKVRECIREHLAGLAVAARRRRAQCREPALSARVRTASAPRSWSVIGLPREARHRHRDRPGRPQAGRGSGRPLPSTTADRSRLRARGQVAAVGSPRPLDAPQPDQRLDRVAVTRSMAGSRRRAGPASPMRSSRYVAAALGVAGRQLDEAEAAQLAGNSGQLARASSAARSASAISRAASRSPEVGHRKGVRGVDRGRAHAGLRHQVPPGAAPSIAASVVRRPSTPTARHGRDVSVARCRHPRPRALLAHLIAGGAAPRSNWQANRSSMPSTHPGPIHHRHRADAASRSAARSSKSSDESPWPVAQLVVGGHLQGAGQQLSRRRIDLPSRSRTAVLACSRLTAARTARHVGEREMTPREQSDLPPASVSACSAPLRRLVVTLGPVRDRLPAARARAPGSGRARSADPPHVAVP